MNCGTVSWPGLVCTSSLELGIDVGSVRRIVQVHSPKSVDRMLQRVGRADHRLGGVGRGHVISWDVDHLLESAVVAQRAMVGAIEPVVWRKRPGVIAANQLVLMAHCFKAVSIDEATRLIANAPQFDGWQRVDTEAMLQVLAERWVVRFTPVPSEGRMVPLAQGRLHRRSGGSRSLEASHSRRTCRSTTRPTRTSPESTPNERWTYRNDLPTDGFPRREKPGNGCPTIFR